jgi:hypothetical protein
MLLKMPRSHICPSCLTELARIRAVPDPHYGLAVVVCPKCSLACVRTKHPDQAFWRSVRRGLRSGRLMVLTIMMTALSAGALAGMSFAMRSVLTDRRGNFLEPGEVVVDEVYFLLGALLLVMLGGCVVRVVYAHLPLWAAWLMLMIPGTVFVYLDLMIGWGANQMRKMLELNQSLEVPSHLELLGRSRVFLLLAGMASIGMLLGIVMNRMIVASSRKRVSKIRRKINKRRVRQY